MNLLSRPEELLLLAVWRLQEEAYGAAIRNHLSDVTGEDWSIGSVYAPLDRLARKGFIRSYLGPPTPERGGRSKRFFRLTAEGVAALDRVRTLHESMWKGLPQLGLGGA
jgi:DNA-binding PadR family transcriptional regulator